MMNMLARFLACAAVCWLASSGEAVMAEGGKTTRIIVPFPPGGTADVIARLLGQQAGQSSGQTFLVENRPGAGTIIATEVVARAPPDGTTLLLMANSFVINASLRSNLSYDPLTSFEPICLLVNSPQVLVVNSASAYRSFTDLRNAVQARPGALSYATVGPATTQHIAAEMLRRAAQLDMIYVPYTGGAPAVNALLGGHVTSVLANYSEVGEQVAAGKLRALAVTTRERMDALPDVPTVAELGYKDYEATAYFGIVAPAGTPKQTVAQLSALFTAALGAPEVKPKLLAQGLYPAGVCGADFAAHLQSQHAHYARVIREANIKAE